jgi:hypothetical protein
MLEKIGMAICEQKMGIFGFVNAEILQTRLIKISFKIVFFVLVLICFIITVEIVNEM